jgi:hypothetical protein
MKMSEIKVGDEVAIWSGGKYPRARFGYVVGVGVAIYWDPWRKAGSPPDIRSEKWSVAIALPPGPIDTFWHCDTTRANRLIPAEEARQRLKNNADEETSRRDHERAEYERTQFADKRLSGAGIKAWNGKVESVDLVAWLESIGLLEAKS